MSNSISFNIGIGELELSKEGVRDMWGENQIMKDALLFLLNPEVVGPSDVIFGSIEQVKEECRGLYGKGFSQEFIDRVFKV